MSQSYARARKELRELRKMFKATMTLEEYKRALAHIEAATEAVTAKNRPGSGWRKLIGQGAEAAKAKKNAAKYQPAERALIENRGAPCLTCNCSDDDRATCEAW